MIKSASRQEPGLAGISAYSQVRLNADEYPLAPENLELEQVHVYVRHGACPSGLHLQGDSRLTHCRIKSRRTHTGGCPPGRTACFHTRALEYVSHRPQVPGSSIKCSWI